MSECCPLCRSANVDGYWQDKQRHYYQCVCCALVFVDPAQRLSAQMEKAEYDRHQNSPDDKGYRQFLSRLYQPMLAKLKYGQSGLDFGCGPGPTLSLMFEQAGYPMAIYDPYYFDDKEVLDRSYPFITATEVVEHLYNPGAVMKQLWSLLEPGGTLGLMTKLVKDQQAFALWHYKNDPTHVCFFSQLTFSWLASELEADLEFVGDDVILLGKKIQRQMV